MREIIEKIFKKNNLELSQKNIGDFINFFNLLVEENKKYNLTRITEFEDVVKKHYLDSVASNRFIEQNSKVIDIGAGAGFPSIPLKIIRGDLSFTLVDSVNKKVGFLNLVIDKLNLSKMTAIHSRCEDLAHNNLHREAYDVCLARAVAELNVLVEYCLPFVKVGGCFIAYKSGNSQEEIEKAKKAIDILGGEIKTIIKYSIDEKENCLILITKVRRTPNTYPRRGNKPRKMPIL
jgi:16S rRNA (guanine527-N7)-methyltransferase